MTIRSYLPLGSGCVSRKSEQVTDVHVPAFSTIAARLGLISTVSS